MTLPTESDETRLSIMKKAAIAVLDTLTVDDYANVIEFSTSAESYSTHLLSMNEENKCLLENFIDDLDAAGNTDYENAFELAFEIMSNSINDDQTTSVSGCSAQVILFFTDGEISQGRRDIVELIDELKNMYKDDDIYFKILTYAIGDDLDQNALDKLLNISCSNQGIYYRIEDITDDISSIMASYYQMFASLRNTKNEDSWVVWGDHLDTLTGYRVMSAALPVYDKTTNPHTLLGVSVAEVNSARLIDPNLSQWGIDVGLYHDFDSVFQDMLNSAKTCPTLDFTFDQLETIRKSLPNAHFCGVITIDIEPNTTIIDTTIIDTTSITSTMVESSKDEADENITIPRGTEVDKNDTGGGRGKKGSVNTEIIIISVVGIVLFLLIVIGGVIYFIKQRQPAGG